MWQVNCAKNTAKALLPFQDVLRSLKHQMAPPRIGPHHRSVVAGGFDHIAALRRHGLDLRGAHVLELGSGWFPIIPLMLRIAGAERVILTDAHRLMTAGSVVQAAAFLRQTRGDLANRLDLSPDAVADALACPENGDLEALLAHFGFTYLAPFDAATDTPPVDAVVSQTVFEHIPPEVLRRILRGMRDSLKPGGLMSHGIDNTDHRANHDPRLGDFDFLRYSDRVWRMLCLNPQDYTNRLRHSDYIALFDEAGLEIAEEEAITGSRAVDEVRALPLSERFRERPPQDLAVAWTHLVARPKAAAARTAGRIAACR